MRLVLSKMLLLILLFTNSDVLLSQEKAAGKTKEQEIVVNVNTAATGTTISPLLMGFNNVYCYEPDKYWQNGAGKIAKHLQGLHTGIVRYPGGTVVTRFNWEQPTGQGWAEPEEAKFNPAKNLQPTEFMDINEYLDYTKKLGIEPLIGINMSTGIKYNKVQEYLELAKRLVKHCKEKNADVKYYYLDNEPYLTGISYKFTAASYAEQFNLYADAIRSVDPTVKLIANTHPDNYHYADTLLQIAGRNIDIFDIHYYWYWGRASFENWKAQPAMLRPGAGTLAEQRMKFKELGKKYGIPDIELVVLEWNVGPETRAKATPNTSTAPRRTKSQIALMVAEQFSDVLKSGMPMACFWPASWPTTMDRALLASEDDYSANKVYYIFEMYKSVLGQTLLSATASAPRLSHIAAKSKDGKTLWVYLINKTKNSGNAAVAINLTGGRPASVTAAVYDIHDDHTKVANIKHLAATTNGNKVNISMPQYAFAKVTIQLK